ncbi:AAA family ATPase [Peptoniphilus harei]|uniref:Chromosome segregation protein n=1 Tax=Peptoniphilus harei TaxID=54005 RepID=A0A2X1Y0K0_9FIRM|nr:AAA family ATPase [Peptoniphilus harei]QQT90898.1 AAA family ATPase [Peptoniphilus harei]SPY48517.1 chromosome segregation protein [Peptoniphilus harei]
MIFKELGLLNFGKFEDKKIELQDGINLIYGVNEGGKSTITNFIDGIFYGFSRDSLARKVRDELFEKSRPWSSNLYRGYIILNDGEEDYRISRDFDKDEVSILNLNTGEDLSNDERNFLYSRIPQPGVIFFELNRKIYKSSFYLGQRLSQLEDDASDELKTRINNFSISEDENLDLTKVIEKMEEDLYNLGTKRRKSSEIGRFYDELEKISKDKANFISFKETYKNSIEDYKLSKDKLKNLEYKLKGRKLFELETLKAKLKECQTNESNGENDYKLSELERAIEINKELGIYSSRLDDLLSTEQKNFEVDLDLEEDYKRYKEINREIQVLNENNYSKEMEIISWDIKNLEREIFKYILKFMSSMIIGGAVIFISLYFKKYLISIGSILFFTYSYFRIVKFRENKDLLNRLKNKYQDYRIKSQEKTLIKKEFDKEISEILNKYGARDKKELSELFDSKLQENFKNISRNEYTRELMEKNSLEIEDTKKKILEHEENLENIFNKYGVQNIKGLKTLFHYKKDDNRISEYKYRIEKLEKENLSGDLYKEENIEEIQEKIDKEKNNILNLEGSLKTLDESLEKLRVLDERSCEITEKLEKLEYKKELLELSIEKMEDFVKSKRKNTFPLLKKEISQYLSCMTHGKYEEILIDDTFGIRVYDKDIEDFVDLDSLSLGTIDQIYLAFRLSISKIISDKEIPLVLDSHFDAYDDKRLKESLKMLESQQQVLIFTSTNREKEILDKNNMAYNLIKI